MKVLLAPDSMKDSLSASEACAVMKEGILAVNPLANVHCCPISDGGEGLIEVLHGAGLGKLLSLEVEDPLGRPKKAFFLSLDAQTYILEMAQSSGLDLLSPPERNPLYTSTKGLGQLIRHVLSLGASKIYIGIGGSATHDLGLGVLSVLGIDFYDKNNSKIEPKGDNLSDIVRIDTSGFAVPENVDFIGITDVENPLLGADGAAHTYARQKGANEHEIELLEQGGEHIAHLLSSFVKPVNPLGKGTGAAGGLGFGLVTFLGLKVLRGVEVVGSLLCLDEKIATADIVITLEGRTDHQTLKGKAPYSIGQLAQKHKKTVIHFTGSWDSTLNEHVEKVFDVVVPIQDKPMDTTESIKRAPELLKDAVIRTFSLITIGNKIR